jgi:hypothetical protein
MAMELLAGYVAGKVVDITLEHAYRDLLQRWSSYRARKYFESFKTAIAEENLGNGSSTDLIELLKKCDSNDEISSVLFDAYRRVVLCSSREIGPRIIGIVTARIILDERVANEYEERIFMAAESLSDSELQDFQVTADSWEGRLTEGTDGIVSDRGLLRIKLHAEQIDSNSSNKEADMSPINLAEELGLWALKLKNIGILWERNAERTWSYSEDSERRIFADGTVREVIWYVEMPLQYLQLRDLITKVKRALESG